MNNLPKKYHKKDIATAQLKTAIELFLKYKYLSGSITLSSAAGTILSQLARNTDEECFIDYACRIYAHLNKGQTPARKEYNHHIDKILGVPPHKHMNNSDSETVELDMLACAEDGITRAISDYVALYGQKEAFIKHFLQWKWDYRNGKKLMEELNYEQRRIYQLKDAALYRFTIGMYGIVDY